MQKICIVNKGKSRNCKDILKSKKIKIKIGTLTMLFVLMFVSFQNYILASDNTDEFGNYRIYSYSESFRYIKYQSRPQRIHEYYYINTKSEQLPAYCMNLGADGAETVEGGYDVNASEYLNDITVNNIILNGYPYKTVSELNVDNESEARYATQFAIWIKLNNLDINQIEPMEPQYSKVVDAIKNIYYNGISYNLNYTNGVSIIEIDKNEEGRGNLDNIDQSYYSKEYELQYGDNILDINLNVEGVNDYIIVDENNSKIENILENKKFKILFKRKSNLEDAEFKISVECKYKEHAVMFARTLREGMQNMSLSLAPIKENSTEITSKIKTIHTKLEIEKKDAKDENIFIPNVKFNIYDEKDNLIGEYVTNDKGKICIDVEKDLKIFTNTKLKIKEIEVPYPYIIDENNSNKEIEINVGDNVKVEFKNDKLEEKPKIELPKTGY